MSLANIRSVCTKAALANFPIIFVFFLLPATIFANNRLDLDYDPTPVLLLASFALVSFVLTAALMIFVPSLSRLVVPLFLLGLFLFISDSVVPPNWGALDGADKLTETPGSIWTLAALAATLVIAWLRVPTTVMLHLGKLLLAVAVCWQILTLVFASMAAPNAIGAAANTSADASNTNKPNVYHFLLDGYSGPSFLSAAERVGIGHLLKGFTYFPNNLSNYDVTSASLPSVFLGELFTGGSFKEFQDSLQTNDFRWVFKKANYRISTYGLTKYVYWGFAGSDYAYTGESSNLLKIAQIVAVRAAPDPWRQEVLKFSKDALKSWKPRADLASYRRVQIPMFERFLLDEVTRPSSGQYVFVHLLLPHAPYLWDADCAELALSSYANQLDCATRVIGRIIEALANWDKLDGSVVVIHSDHGYEHDPAGKAFRPGSEAVIDHVRSNDNAYTPEGFFARLNSLLLVKPANDREPFRVSGKLTQLADVAATILDLTGMPEQKKAGKSVLRLSDVEDREISVFSGFIKKNSEGRNVTLGQSAKSADFIHLKYSAANGWAIGASITATHEGH